MAAKRPLPHFMYNSGGALVRVNHEADEDASMSAETASLKAKVEAILKTVKEHKRSVNSAPTAKICLEYRGHFFCRCVVKDH
jgi:hypothetical protein